ISIFGGVAIKPTPPQDSATGASKTLSAPPPPVISCTDRSCQIPATVSVFQILARSDFSGNGSCFPEPAIVCFQLSANCRISRFGNIYIMSFSSSIFSS
ncbi:hypothetical protein HAX54_001465, partial [Datura stramonium]|nr:hypothetical protein [Datura stramonium]